MRRLGKILAWTSGVLVLLLVAGAIWGVWAVRRPFPDYTTDVALSGLQGDVEVVRDAQGIPTVWADTPTDLFRAQGYLHAQDRFWEMDFRRHVTSGRLSELFGESQLETDTFLRTMGWRRVAEAEVPLLNPQSRSYYEAYAAGVNAYLDTHDSGDIALPYTILGLQRVQARPEPWTVADSLAWYKALAWDLKANLTEEVDRALLSALLPPDRVDQLYPGFPYDRQQAILTPEDVSAGVAATAASGPVARTELTAEVRTQLAAVSAVAAAIPNAVGRGPGIGSNSWVVAPERTASGSAILANDPHLAPSMPSVWTQTHLRCRAVTDRCPYDVQGFAFSGMPGVLIGHNADVAWGLTTTYADTMDLYLEKVDAGTYLTESGPEPLTSIRETIKVAGQDDVIVDVRLTRHGPLISDTGGRYADVGRDAPVEAEAKASAARDEGYAVALRWASLTPGKTGDAIFAMNRASTWEDFRDATELLESPVQNIVYADRSGNVGYQVNGVIPLRRGYEGRDVVPGWTGEYDWVETLTVDQKPHVLNPAKGYLATANEAAVPEDYPYVITTDANPAYRGDRIRELLATDEAVTNDASNTIAMDTKSGVAEMLVPTLLAVPGLRGYYADGQRLLTDWDYTTPADSAPAAYFQSVWSNLLRLTFHDELPEEMWPSGGSRWWEVVNEMLTDPLDPYWDDVSTQTVVETRDQILQTALKDARDECTRRMSKDPEEWAWGRLHTLELQEATFGSSGIGPIEWLFNRGPYQVAGGSDIVQANGWDAAEGFGVTNVPSMRMQIDFADLDASRWIQLSGQSGHPFHDNYVDQTEQWRTGGTLPMRWTDDAVREAGVTSMMFTPAAPPVG